MHQRVRVYYHPNLLLIMMMMMMMMMLMMLIMTKAKERKGGEASAFPYMSLKARAWKSRLIRFRPADTHKHKG